MIVGLNGVVAGSRLRLDSTAYSLILLPLALVSRRWKPTLVLDQAARIFDLAGMRELLVQRFSQGQQQFYSAQAKENSSSIRRRRTEKPLCVTRMTVPMRFVCVFNARSSECRGSA